MAASEPLHPRVFARFKPEPVDARVYANFSPRVADSGRVHATFKPEVWERAQNALADALLTGPTPDAPPEAPLTKDQQLLSGILSLLSPDDASIQNKYVTAQVNAGQAYDYQFPVWCRHFLLTNADNGPTDTGTAAQLYYWYDLPSQGSKVLPQNYATLIGGQSISENSDYDWITVFANAAAVNQGWELRFSGRSEDKMRSSRPGTAASQRSNSLAGTPPAPVSVPPVLVSSPPRGLSSPGAQFTP